MNMAGNMTRCRLFVNTLNSLREKEPILLIGCLPHPHFEASIRRAGNSARKLQKGQHHA